MKANALHSYEIKFAYIATWTETDYDRGFAEHREESEEREGEFEIDAPTLAKAIDKLRDSEIADNCKLSGILSASRNGGKAHHIGLDF